MSNRFERLYELPNNQYSPGSPVILMAGALLKDTQSNNVLVQLKFQSACSESIHALCVDIEAYDITGREIQGRNNYQYLDLSIQNGHTFGSNKAIILPDITTRSFSIRRLSVVLSDGTTEFVSLPLIELAKGMTLQESLGNIELVKQYRLATNSQAFHVPFEYADLWMCSCGQWNKYNTCTSCHISRQTVFSAYDLDILSTNLNHRFMVEQENLRIEAELKERKRSLRKDRNKKLFAILSVFGFLLSAILIFTVWFYPRVIKPYSDYKKADALFNEGKYDAAISAFQALGNYKDSPDRLEEVEFCIMDDIYNHGIQLMTDGEYEAAIEQFESLGEHRDSTSKISEIKSLLTEMKYNDAIDLFTEESYEDSMLLFKELAEYKDSENFYNQCVMMLDLEEKYKQATLLYNNGYYNMAFEIFTELDAYKDSTEYAQLCKNNFSSIDTNNILTLFPTIEYEISINSLCSILGVNEYTDRIASYSNGIMYRSYYFDTNYVLNGIPSKISFRFKWEDKSTRDNETAGKLISMTWHCPEEISNYEMYLELKQHITNIIGAPTDETTGKNYYDEIYAYYTYWNDMQLSYSTVTGQTIYLGRSQVWSNE